jgi:DNA-binding transcriptional LysR family regulator
VELRQLRTFVTVAEEASFTRAAERLHVVQSAVSSGVRSLERQLGTSLFVRTTHRVDLTDAGRALLPEARATLAAAAAAREAVDEVRGGLRGTVRLGILQGQVMRHLNVPSVLAEFHDEHPGVTVEVRHAGGSSTTAEQVREGRLDLAFVALAGHPAPGLALTPLWHEPFRLALPTTHRLRDAAAVDLTALAGEPFAELPPGWGTRVATDRAFAAAGMPRSVSYEVNDTATLVEFVRYGLAVALLPASAVEQVPDIVTVPLDPPLPDFEIAVAVPAERRPSAGTRALSAVIRRQRG